MQLNAVEYETSAKHTERQESDPPQPMENEELQREDSQKDIQPKHPIVDVTNAEMYKQLSTVQEFGSEAQEKKVEGLFVSAFEDRRPLYKCSNEETLDKDGLCIDRKVISSKRVAVVGAVTVMEAFASLDSENKWLWKKELQFKCDFGKGNSVDAIVKTHPLSHSSKHQALLLLCPLSDSEPFPTSISISMESPVRVHLAQVAVIRDPAKPRGNTLEACIAPIHGDISENLIEWIEYHRMMGGEALPLFLMTKPIQIRDR